MKSKQVKIKDLQFAFEGLDLAETGENNEQKQFSGTAYSGLPIFNHPYWGNLIFDTSNITSEPLVPVLFNHDPNRIVGFGSLRVDSGIFIDGKFSDVTPDGQQVRGMIEEGFPMKQSVFIEPSRVDKVGEGKTFSVNGQELSGPFTIFRDSKIKEVSMTPLPADSNTETHLFNERLSGTISLEEQDMSEDKKVEEPKVEEPKTEEPKTEAPATEEPKAEEPKKAEPETSDEEKQFMELAKSDLSKAFKFACGCKGKTEDAAVSLSDENDQLKNEIAELKKQMKKQERFSDLEDMEASKGLKFSDEAKESMLGLDDESFSSLIKGVKVENKKAVSKELLKEAKFSSDSQPTFDISGLELDTAVGMQNAAKKFMEFKKTQGQTIDQIDAIVEIQKLTA